MDGLRQILWGLFKKIVIADKCARYVNQVFSTYQSQSGSTLLLAGVLFAIQIYCDFSGYSDIALGTARLFGIELLRNFAYPYFSRDIAEFWRRWHISLTTWFRDYLYIPLGGSRGSKWKVIRNTFIIFLVSGFWHGANWTFLVWGAFHALLFIPLLLLQKNRKNTNQVAEGRVLPTLKEFTQMCFTFLFVVVGWIFFRSDSITQAVDYISRLFSISFFSIPLLINRDYYIPLFFNIGLLLFIEWQQRSKKHGLDLFETKQFWIRWSLYFLISGLIVWFCSENISFIYFQF